MKPGELLDLVAAAIDIKPQMAKEPGGKLRYSVRLGDYWLTRRGLWRRAGHGLLERFYFDDLESAIETATKSIGAEPWIAQIMRDIDKEAG